MQLLIVKRSSSSYKKNVLQIFSGKKPFLSSTFKYLNYNCRPLGLPPKRLILQFPNASYSSISHARDWLNNCRNFQSCSSITIHFVLFMRSGSFRPCFYQTVHLPPCHGSLTDLPNQPATNQQASFIGMAFHNTTSHSTD